MSNTSTQNVALAYKKENALNAICPYFTMFPLEYPNRVLKKHLKEQPVVLDPFCGRGTTLFSARKFGLSAWGIDSSPVAVAIAKAKLASCDIEAPLELAAELIADVEPADLPDTPFFVPRITGRRSVIFAPCAKDCSDSKMKRMHRPYCVLLHSDVCMAHFPSMLRTRATFQIKCRGLTRQNRTTRCDSGRNATSKRQRSMYFEYCVERSSGWLDLIKHRLVR